MKTTNKSKASLALSVFAAGVMLIPSDKSELVPNLFLGFVSVISFIDWLATRKPVEAGK